MWKEARRGPLKAQHRHVEARRGPLKAQHRHIEARRGPLKAQRQDIPGRANGNRETPQFRKSVLRLRFEPAISQIKVRSASAITHLIRVLDKAHGL
jgi:hypothetical protein